MLQSQYEEANSNAKYKWSHGISAEKDVLRMQQIEEFESLVSSKSPVQEDLNKLGVYDDSI